MSFPRAAHPSAQELSDYALGKLPEERMTKLETHLQACGTCIDAVAKARQDSFAGKLKQAGPPPAVPSPGPRPAAAPDALPLDQWPAALRGQAVYRVRRLLGQGGMGAVYLAHHAYLDKPVALKVISPELLQHPEALPRFLEEVKNAARLDHPNIVRALHAEPLGKTYVFVMEYVEGTDLHTLLQQAARAGKRIPVASACRWVRQAALGLQHAHEKGMVHRDIKPANLIVARDGSVKVLDFGLAKLVSEEAGRLVQSVDGFKGTVDYVSPEQALDARQADIRSDIYSLGCTLFALLTGRPPFARDTQGKALVARLEQEAPPVTEFRANVPAGLADVVARMLAKEPRDRYQTPAEVAEALAAYTGEAGTVLPRRQESRETGASVFKDLGAEAGSR